MFDTSVATYSLSTILFYLVAFGHSKCYLVGAVTICLQAIKTEIKLQFNYTCFKTFILEWPGQLWETARKKQGDS